MKKMFGAVDIGGTKICVGIVQDDVSVLCQDSFPTPVEVGGGQKAVEKLLAILEEQCEHNNITLADLSGIGIVCTGPVNVKQGMVENPYTLPGWGSYPIVEEVARKSQLPVRLENDANGALMGELLCQNIQKKRVLMLTFGTGIGSAFWNGSEIHRCKDGIHAEMGHILVSLEGEECYCGSKGCFEKQCSGTSLNERSRILGFANFDEVYEKRNVDSIAQDMLRTVSLEIKNGVLSLCAVFQPEVIIFGGGFSKNYFQLMEEIVIGSGIDNKDFVGTFKMTAANTSVNSALLGTLMLFS